MARLIGSVTDKVRAQNSYPVSSTIPLTVSCWFLPSSARNSYGTIVEIQSHLGTNNAYSAFIGLSGTSNHLAYYNNGTTNLDPGTASITTNVWAHVALTITSSGHCIAYVNGAAEPAFSLEPATLTSTPCDIYIGFATTGGGQNNGWTFADAATWTTNLTAAEVTALANGARPRDVRLGSLHAWLPLDGLQSPEPDLSGNAVNGTLTGTSLAASGPPVMMFTPRWPLNSVSVVSTGTSFQPAWAGRNRIVVEGIGI